MHTHAHHYYAMTLLQTTQACVPGRSVFTMLLFFASCVRMNPQPRAPEKAVRVKDAAMAILVCE